MQGTDKIDAQTLERNILWLEGSCAKQSKTYTERLKKVKLELDLTLQRKNELNVELCSLREASQVQSQQVTSFMNILNNPKYFNNVSTGTTSHSRGSTCLIPQTLNTTSNPRLKPKQSRQLFRHPALKQVKSADQKLKRNQASKPPLPYQLIARPLQKLQAPNDKKYMTAISSPRAGRQKLPLTVQLNQLIS